MFSRKLLREFIHATSVTSSDIRIDHDCHLLQNRDCQRSDWQSHKKVCKLCVESRELMKATSAKAALDSTGQILDLKPVESKLKQWILVRSFLFARGYKLHSTAHLLAGISVAVRLCCHKCSDPTEHP